MSATPEHIHPEFDRMLGRHSKEALLKQKGIVIWLVGLSGSGKSTLANALERKLHAEGLYTQILDGDNIRAGLNKDLGFTDEDRKENIRRIAEVAKLFKEAGAITITSFITPKEDLRQIARETIGEADYFEVFVRCPFEVCAERDVKGLYAKAKAGEVQNFTGMGSDFEDPANPRLLLETSQQSLEESLEILYTEVAPLLKHS